MKSNRANKIWSAVLRVFNSSFRLMMSFCLCGYLLAGVFQFASAQTPPAAAPVAPVTVQPLGAQPTTGNQGAVSTTPPAQPQPAAGATAGQPIVVQTGSGTSDAQAEARLKYDQKRDSINSCNQAIKEISTAVSAFNKACGSAKLGGGIKCIDSAKECDDNSDDDPVASSGYSQAGGGLDIAGLLGAGGGCAPLYPSVNSKCNRGQRQSTGRDTSTSSSRLDSAQSKADTKLSKIEDLQKQGEEKAKEAQNIPNELKNLQTAYTDAEAKSYEELQTINDKLGEGKRQAYDQARDQLFKMDEDVAKMRSAYRQQAAAIEGARRAVKAKCESEAKIKAETKAAQDAQLPDKFRNAGTTNSLVARPKKKLQARERDRLTCLASEESKNIVKAEQDKLLLVSGDIKDMVALQDTKRQQMAKKLREIELDAIKFADQAEKAQIQKVQSLRNQVNQGVDMLNQKIQQAAQDIQTTNQKIQLATNEYNQAQMEVQTAKARQDCADLQARMSAGSSSSSSSSSSSDFSTVLGALEDVKYSCDQLETQSSACASGGINISRSQDICKVYQEGKALPPKKVENRSILAPTSAPKAN